MKFSTNPQLELAFEFVQNTSQNIFLTGKAGTGKTTFLSDLRKRTHKRMIVVAPTGVAAINAGGVTIHSFFQISFGPQIPVATGEAMMTRIADKSAQPEAKKINREKISIIRSLDLLVIDEISMVRADLMDAVDEVLRRYKDRHIPFGGVQLLMIGDLQQLAPVVKEEEWQILKNYYSTAFFFSSRALQKSKFISIELKHIFRQSNQHFIDLLNKIRNNEADTETIAELNKRFQPDFNPDDKEGYITLTTHNWQAKNINESKLSVLKGKEHHFKAELKGEFPELSFPTEFDLVLKNGAQVMFVKNDISPGKLYFNGKIGRITGFDEDTIEVLCTGDTEPISVEPVEWRNVRYNINETTQEISEDVIGNFVQYPLKLAWAITIHKSQGLTFDKAVIDAHASFAHGQVYVALSRCRTLEGLVLRTPLSPFSIKNDDTVREFSRIAEEKSPTHSDLEEAKIAYLRQLFDWLFDFKPLQRKIHNALNLWEEHKDQLDGNLDNQMLLMLKPLQEELIPVAEKFCNQLWQLTENNPDAETNPVLQERLEKAANWFLEKVETNIIKPLGESSYVTDNRAIMKSMDESAEKISEAIHVQSECLKVCKKGFSMYAFTGAKARAALSKPDYFRHRDTRRPMIYAEQKHPELYRILTSWRLDRAKDLKTEPYQILSQKLLQQIIKDLPVTQKQLKAVKGFGKKKWQLHGKELLKTVVDYCIDHGADISEDIRCGDEQGKKKADSKQITYDLFLSGKSVQKIALEREMAVSTIEGHLAFFVRKGMITPDQLMAPEKIALIAGFFLQHENVSIGEAKEELGEKYSYGELKLVRSYLESRQDVD